MWEASEQHHHTTSWDNGDAFKECWWDSTGTSGLVLLEPEQGPKLWNNIAPTPMSGGLRTAR